MSDEPKKEGWGAILRRTRESLGLKRTEVAERSGVPYKSIAKWEYEGSRSDDGLLRVLRTLQEEAERQNKEPSFSLPEPRVNVTESEIERWRFMAEMLSSVAEFALSEIQSTRDLPPGMASPIKRLEGLKSAASSLADSIQQVLHEGGEPARPASGRQRRRIYGKEKVKR